MNKDLTQSIQSNLSNYQCNHDVQTHKSNYCQKCGIKIFQDCMAHKTSRFKSWSLVNPNNFIKFVSISQKEQLKHSIIRNNLLDFMIEGATKLSFHPNTYHLAVQYLDSFLTAQDPMPDISTCNIIASTALMLAAKTIELDYNIPFITKLKKYCSLSDDVKEFRDWERKLIKHLNWELQQRTLIDAIESLLSLGVVFSTDRIDDSAMKRKLDRNQLVMEICSRIERDYVRVANLVLRDGDLVGKGIQMKAVACVLFLRKLHHVEPVDGKQLNGIIGDEDKSEVMRLVDYLVMLLEPIFSSEELRHVRTSSKAGSPLGVKKHYTCDEMRVGREPLLSIGNNGMQRKKTGGCSGVRQVGLPQCALRLGMSVVVMRNNKQMRC